MKSGLDKDQFIAIIFVQKSGSTEKCLGAINAPRTFSTIT